MIAPHSLPHRFFVAGSAAFIASLLFAQGVHAQRPSVADMQAQIDALTFPYDEPAAQVRTALDILPVFQDAVARTYFQNGVVPVDRTESGLSQSPADTQTSFISSVAIVNGTVVFRFGNDADASLQNKELAFTPYATADSTVIWKCGNNPIISGVSSLGSPAIASSIPAAAHPNPCILKANAAGPDLAVSEQVKTALDVAPAFMDAVARTYLETGAAPVNREEAGMSPNATDTQTNYISAVDIVDGAVVVTFGNYANALLAGQQFSFNSYASADGTVVWRCGNDPIIAGVTPIGGYDQPTSLLGKYAPRPCITKAYPAGSDDTIKAQILEPFGVVASFQAAVEAAGVTLGSASQPVAPVDRMEAGLSPNAQDTVGHYFESIEIDNGVITVTYGNEINSIIQYFGGQLSWTPYESVDGTIVWVCGDAQPVVGTQLMGTASGGNTPGYNNSSVDHKYLPPQCRP
jgi:type IV pilus assembly protein PilA